MTTSDGYIKYKDGATVTLSPGNNPLYALWKQDVLPSGGVMQWVTDVNGGHIHYIVGGTVLYSNFGDVNLDGKVDADDATLVSQYVNLTTKPDIDLYNADMNRDGKITAVDATIILRFVNGIITSYQL